MTEVVVVASGPDAKPTFTGTNRTFRVWLDTNQYQQDMASVIKGGEVRREVHVGSWGRGEDGGERRGKLTMEGRGGERERER